MDALTTTARPHPLVLLAAASVTVLSLSGVATLAGWLPLTQATPQPAVGQNQPAPVIAQAANATPPAAAAPTAAPRKKLGAGETAPSARRTSPAAHKDAAPPVATTSPSGIEVIAAAPAAATKPANTCADCGVVQSVEEVPVEGKAGNTGAVVGGVVGGILGNQVGKGASRDIATLLGIAGGALAGHQIEKANSKAVRYDIVVRLEDGSIRRIASETPPVWHNGDRVQIQNGELISRG